MLKAKNLKSIMKEEGTANFQKKFREEYLGIVEKENVNGTYPAGFDEKKAKLHASEFSFKELAEAFLGQEFVSGINNPKIQESWMHDLKEATVAVHPSSFSNISAFSAAVTGLMEQSLLQSYDLPEFILTKMIPVIPTRVQAGKVIGHPNIKFPTRATLPSEEAQSLGMQERWVWRQNLIKYNSKIALTREDLLFDRSNELLAHCAAIGKMMGLAKEIYIACTVQGVNLPATASLSPDKAAGVTGNTYVYSGSQTDSPNNTFQTAAGTGASAKYNYVNQSTGKTGITSWTDLQFIRGQMSLASEYETGYRIQTDLKHCLVSPFNYDQANYAVHNTQVFNFPNGFAQSGLQGPNTASNSPLNSPIQVMANANLEQVLVQSGVSQANAQNYVTAGDFTKAYSVYEAWPMEIVPANSMSAELLNSQIVHSLLASMYFVPVVIDPRRVYQFTN